MSVTMFCSTRRRYTRAKLFYNVRKEAFWRCYNLGIKS